MGRGPGYRAVGPEAIQIDFKWKGQRCRERLRLKPTPANLKFVARLKATIEHEITLGTFDYAKHFPDSPRARGSGNDLRAFLLAYVDSIQRDIQPETAKEYRQNVKQFCDEVGGTVEGLDRAKVRKWLAGTERSRKRLENLLIPVRGALSQAVDDGVLKKNPLEGFSIKRATGRKKAVDPFTPEEVKALARDTYGDLWTFWVWTGLRSGEIIGLQWRDVDLESGTLAIRRAVRRGREKEPKTSAGERRMGLLPAANTALAGSRAKSGSGVQSAFVFVRTSGDYWHEAKALNRAFRKACEACKVRPRYVYQLRHTFATWALSSGENPLWVAKQMGHKDTSMIFRHYGKWMPSMDPQAGSRMASKAA